MVFLFILNLSFNTAYQNQNKNYLQNFFSELIDRYDANPTTFEYDNQTLYNDYFIIEDGVRTKYTRYNISEEDFNIVVNQIISEYFEQINERNFINVPYTISGKIAYMGRVIKPIGKPRYAVFVVSNSDEFIENMTGNIPFYATISFLNILVLGNIIIWLWSSSTVNKLKDLQDAVNKMIEDDYQTEVKIEDAAEEISSLSYTINKMRIEIKNNEDTKKEMIQNLGHDLKTPIAVIRSYAEAIQDGIEDVTSTDLIIKQADILNNKVKQIIEYSKIGYIENDRNFEDVSFKEVVTQVVNHYKYITDRQFILDIETDWIHLMDKEGCYIAVSNIVDNAVRYAKTKIVIQLSTKKLTIFNDGEAIETNVLPKIFKAYEKGSKGQFGLGLAIVKETMDRFGLRVSVANHANGVLFTIEL
ncbi:sensor histidine kinase [Acholeplasma granularum]|uniref:sensor histidine kinase n=1 Tax=Acholeplasma granularum TaxID=264635 RepID=UPI00046E81F5|nr:HAMP domain-containing sensor histidine kinase [Acholeplasma granularum]